MINKQIILKEMIELTDDPCPDVIFLHVDELKESRLYDTLSVGQCIEYDYETKKFFPETCRENGVFVGMLLSKDFEECDVLYKGFFLKDPISIGANIKEMYAPIYIKKEFEHARDSIISLMPRVKRLKRMNLKMITRDQALIIYSNLDKIASRYEDVFGYEAAQIFKASLVTTPFFINDNGAIKLYSIETNELKDLDVESEGNFLAYFTYKY